MPIEVSITSTTLAMLCIQGPFYGIYFLMTVTYLLVFFQRRQRSGGVGQNTRLDCKQLVSNPIPIAIILLLFGSTATWVLSIIRLYEAFVWFRNGTVPEDFLEDITQPSYIALMGVIMSCMLVGDAILIYRLWRVYSYSRLVTVLPVCSWVGLFCSAAGILRGFEFVWKPDGDKTLIKWATSSDAFAIFTNIYCAVLIAVKLWSVHSSAKNYGGGRRMKRALIVFIESTALMVSWIIIYSATEETFSNLPYAVIGSIPAIMGISIMLIQLPVALGWTNTAGLPTDLPSQQEPIQPHHSQSAPHSLQPVHVHVKHVVHETDDIGDFHTHSKRIQDVQEA